MARKPYTISVALKAFFADCRAQAKIFISEDIQTVLDLENKISRIFGIKNFHLLSNENLLPSCEDIRLLNKGDIISVLPNDSHTNLLLPQRFYSTNDEPMRCKKKKRQHLDDECPIKEKKCKKKKKEATLFDDEKLDDLTQCEANKNFEDFSNTVKKENKQYKDKAYINQISQQSQSLSSSTPLSIGKMKDFNLHVEKDKSFSSIDKAQKSVNVQEEKMGGEQCIEVNSEKKSNINLLSDESSDAVSGISSAANKHRLLNILTKLEKTKNKQLISSPNDSLSNMIVNSTSSSSDSEMEKTISTTKQSISNNMKQSKFLGQSINKTKTKQNTIQESSETNGLDKVSQKGCSFYQLPKKKRTLWITSPRKETINHVCIKNVPLAVTDTGSSKFVFNPVDIGVIPVPNHETTDKHIMNDISTSDSNIINLSQHNSITLSSTINAPIEEISASACDELNTKFSLYSSNITNKEIVEENHQSSNESLKFIPSQLISKSILKSEEVSPIASSEVSIDSNDSKNIEEKITKKRFVMNKWKQKKLNQVDEATENSLPNQDETSSIVNKGLAANENGQIRNIINQPPQISPEVVKLNSYKINKNTTNDLGMNYYKKLLNGINWDISKTISNVPDEIQSPSENTKLVGQVQSPLYVENKMYSLKSIDLSRSITNLNTDEIQSPPENTKLVGHVQSPLNVENKMYSLESIDLSRSISNLNKDEIQSPPENSKLVGHVQSPLNVENKMYSLESIDLSRSISNLNKDEIQSPSENTKLVGHVQSPLNVENKMYFLESVDLSRSISNLNTDEIQSQSGKEKLVGQVESPLYVQNKMKYLENIDEYEYGNEELVRQEKFPLYVENKMNFLENIDMSSVSSTVIDFGTKRKRKRKHKKRIRADTPATVKSCHFLPSKQHTLVKGTPKLHIRFESDENDYLREEEDEISANIENSSKNVKVLQDVCLDLSRNEENICRVGSLSTQRDIEGNNPNECILSIDIMDASKPTEKEFEIVSVLNRGISTQSTGASLMNIVELHKRNENIVSNECSESISKDCMRNEKNLDYGFQKSALDYTNENLTSYENTYIAKSSSNSPKLGIISPEEALARAKVALLKAVGFLSPVQSPNTRTYQAINADIQNIDISVDGAINLSGSGVINAQKRETFL